MAAKKIPAYAVVAGTGREDVEAFLRTLEHTHKAEILAVREIILGANAKIGEGIKWNAPSFRTVEWFATIHLREKNGVSIILHRGAKKREMPEAGMKIADPSAMLKWLGADRAMVTFRNGDDIASKRLAFEKLIRAWIAHL
jgi:hypothetical protein